MLRGARDQPFLPLADLVGEAQTPAPQPLAPAGHPDRVPVAGRPVIAGLDAGDHQEIAEPLDVGIVEAGGRAEAGAGELEPDHVVGVMDDAHLVGLGIADLDVDLGADGLCHLFCHPRMWRATVHRIL